MRVEVVDNVSRKMASVLATAIEASLDARIAAAFVSRRGLSLLEPSMNTALGAGARLEFLIGLDLGFTEPEAVRVLYEMSQKSPKVVLLCYVSLETPAIYHPKLYLLRADDRVTCIVGSSNLTGGGLEKNAEVNAVIEGSTRDEPISDFYNAYNHLKFHGDRVVPDEELVKLYSQLRYTEKARPGGRVAEAPSDSLRKAFREKAKSLRRPKPLESDLVGWARLVYEFLPEGEFTNDQVYKHEREFQKHYPKNLHVRDKVRQQLQILEKMGLIEHIEKGRWRKV